MDPIILLPLSPFAEPVTLSSLPPFAEHREPRALPIWGTLVGLAEPCSAQLFEKDFSSENQSVTDLERNTPSLSSPFHRGACWDRSKCWDWVKKVSGLGLTQLFTSLPVPLLISSGLFSYMKEYL